MGGRWNGQRAQPVIRPVAMGRSDTRITECVPPIPKFNRLPVADQRYSLVTDNSEVGEMYSLRHTSWRMPRVALCRISMSTDSKTHAIDARCWCPA